MIAKSVILDIADNYGLPTYMAVRSIEFYDQDVLNELTESDFAAYATSYVNNGQYYPEFAFDTSLSKLGDMNYRQWASNSAISAVTNQRLIVVFNAEITFDTIVVNNSHHSGIYTTSGVKNTKIYISSDPVTDTTYGAAISNSILIFDGQIPQHVAADVIDDQELLLIGGDGTSLTDIAMDIQAFLSTVNDVELDLSAYYQRIDQCPIDIYVMGNFNFIRGIELDLSAALQVVDVVTVDVFIAGERTKNNFLDISLTDGILIDGISMDISIGDGNKKQDVGIDVRVVSTLPEFKSVYAMQLRTAIREI